MSTWKIAGVQMDCRLGDKAANLTAMRAHLAEASRRSARLIVFPECVLTGYGFDSLAEATPYAEALPGPATTVLAEDCRRLNVFAAVGMLEAAGPGDLQRLRARRPERIRGWLPQGASAVPGRRSLHDAGRPSLRGPRSRRPQGRYDDLLRRQFSRGVAVLMLLSATSFSCRRIGRRPLSTVCHLVQARALENHIYYAAVNRVGEERGFRFIGQSRLVGPSAELLAIGGEYTEEILLAEIDPAVARNKHLVKIPGKYELDRLANRRPELYGPLSAG